MKRLLIQEFNTGGLQVKLRILYDSYVIPEL